MLMQEKLQTFFAGMRSAVDLKAWALQFVTEDVVWNVAHPVNELKGIDQLLSGFIEPLLHSLPDLERKPFIAIEDSYQNDEWVNGTGYLLGVFSNDLFGIPAHGKMLSLRYTEMVKFSDGKISEMYLIPDFIDVMEQVGVSPLRPSLGASGHILPFSQGSKESGTAEYNQSSVQLVEDMLDCLRMFDGKSLQTMDLAAFWHEDFIWYGPAGIGTTRGIDGFRQQHQGPFVFSFPDRDVDCTLNIIANGDFISTGGWPHMSGSHTGLGGWLGLPPTGKAIKLRVMDIWRRKGDRLKENWVAIDICHIAQQLGLDIFEQMKKIKNKGVRYE